MCLNASKLIIAMLPWFVVSSSRFLPIWIPFGWLFQTKPVPHLHSLAVNKANKFSLSLVIQVILQITPLKTWSPWETNVKGRHERLRRKGQGGQGNWMTQVQDPPNPGPSSRGLLYRDLSSRAGIEGEQHLDSQQNYSAGSEGLPWLNTKLILFLFPCRPFSILFERACHSPDQNSQKLQSHSE